MRNEKQLLLDEMKDYINQYNTFLITKYTSLSANTANKFRREIAGIGGNVAVIKKRVLLKAAEAAGFNIDKTMLDGHISIVFAGKDPIETTKTVFRYSEETEKAIEVIGGRFEGQLYKAEQVEMLSKLPGKDEMRAQLLSVFEAPMAQTLAVMDAILASVVYCLDNKCKEQGDGS